MTERFLPAYPLFVKDPNFSLWSATDGLNESNVQTWWGAEKRVYGFIKTGGKTYCFLGKSSDFKSCGVAPAEQLEHSVTAFTTDYRFRAGNTQLKFRFVSPLPPDDAELLSLPVCYLEYETEGEKAEISLFVNRGVCFNDIPANTERGVRGGSIKAGAFENAFFGLKRQLPLSNHDDAIGADWGYWHVAGEHAYLLDEADLAAYLSAGFTDFCCAGEERYIAAVNNGKNGALLIGFDETVSIDYFGKYLKGYYLESHTMAEALVSVWETRAEIGKRLERFDKDLRARAEGFGADYLAVLYASLRQSVAAHKLVKDESGELLFLSKECCSNGCIATVDVSYPSMPLYLLYNTELVKGMMRPILKFAQMPVWTFDYAPHDVGTYPACCGQVYGLNADDTAQKGRLAKRGFAQTHFPYYLLPAEFEVYDPRFQMPVEECANMLVMFLACYRCDKDISFFASHASLAEKWVKYLVDYGLKPENQLCTDDFAGHLKNNVNLAVKATVGIAAYAELVKALGGKDEGYRKTAEKFAAEITAFGNKFGHLPITWDSDGDTFSLKYNFAFDKILRLGLFPQDLLERETDCYLQKANAYGTPLDNRESYTKSDWLTWAAALTDDAEKRKKLLAPLAVFLKSSPDRVPFGDWYDTVSGKYLHFRARSVQGGCFILLLK